MTDLQPPAAADVERMAGELQALRSELAARRSCVTACRPRCSNMTAH